MSIEYAVQLKGVSKIYSLKKKEKSKIKNQFYALKDITFNVEKGDVVGILGTNGSGKSTLSSILSEISSPDEGTVKISGEQALIAINTGLNNQLTGFENIQLKGALLGLSKKKIEEITNGVIEFAELGDFLYQPVKNYSSGMKSRLGFSISICLNPDIIIIDEALSVGDKAFADKCIKKFEEFKEQGKTIFFISHSLPQVKSFCTKGLWIEGGRLKCYGPIEEVAFEYSKHVESFKKLTEAEKRDYSQKIFKSRLIKQKSKSIKKQLKRMIKKVNRRFYARVVIISILMIGLLTTGIYSFGMLFNKQSEDDKTTSLTIQQEPYNFIFLLEGPDVNLYKDSYRFYLDNYQGNTILDIVKLQIGPEGELIFTRIPTLLQVYYDELDVHDDLRFLYLIEAEQQSLNEKLSQIVGSKIDNIFTIDQATLLEIMNELGVSLIINDDKYAWNIDDHTFRIDYTLYDDETNQTNFNLFEAIINKFISLDSDKRELLFNQLTKNSWITSEEGMSLYQLINNDQIEISMDSLHLKSKLISEIIDENYHSKINDPEVLEKRILTLDENLLSKNIYISTLNNNVELYMREEESDVNIVEEESEQEQYDQDLNGGNHYSTQLENNSSENNNSSNISDENEWVDNSSGEELEDELGESNSEDNLSGNEWADNSSGEELEDELGESNSEDNLSGNESGDNLSGSELEDNLSGNELEDDLSESNLQVNLSRIEAESSLNLNESGTVLDDSISEDN